MLQVLRSTATHAVEKKIMLKGKKNEARKSKARLKKKKFFDAKFKYPHVKYKERKIG